MPAALTPGIPSLASWKTRTSRTLKPRSALLKAIDAALEQYERSRTEANKTQIRTALNAWIQAKGANWQSNARNGDGVVKQLFDALNPGGPGPASSSTAATSTATPAAPALPPQGWGTQSQKGSLNTIKLASGKEVSLYRQNFENECGPSCVVTVGRLGGRNSDIGPARTKIGSIDHNKPPGMGPGHDWGKDWAYITSLTQTLSGYGVTSAHTRKNLASGPYKSFCEQRTAAKPAILRVDWGNAGHFVVTVGRNGDASQSFIEILDPYYGYQRVDLATFPKYEPLDPDTNKPAKGTLDSDWSVEV